MTKRVAVLNDPTNMGGYVITASGTGFNGIDGVALLGDLASCAKCNSYGKIIEGLIASLLMVNRLLMMAALLRVNARQLVAIKLLL